MSAISIRPATSEDLPYIVTTWVRSFRESPYAGLVPNHLYYSVYEATVTDILARGATLLVACSTDDPDYIVGFACWEHVPGRFHSRHIVHYVFVREKFRRLGIARRLMAKLEDRRAPLYTFRVPGAIDNKIRHLGWRHSPYIARIKYKDWERKNDAEQTGMATDQGTGPDSRTTADGNHSE